MNHDILKAGVVGHPIAHSKSPLIHGYWLKKYGIAGSYERFDIAPNRLSEGVQELVQSGIRGFNVTIPHKVAVMDLCASLSEEAKKIGAVNTVVVGRDGELFGTNTDYFGFLENIKTAHPNFEFLGKKVVVLGSGGAARAIIFGLQSANVSQITIVNRTYEKAEALAREFSCEALPWDGLSSVLSDCDLLVNSTSLGMVGQDELVIDLSPLPSHAIVNDIVYSPLMTSLLRHAQDRGLSFVTGIGMLLHQARPGFELWFGRPVDVDADLQALVLA
ncbi:MAG: shikimate dehydrogenase [Alphaproteobacteria bacterium]|nr:shikimate dehydrogenase [Alphaproteobacteria bacterium]